MSLTTIVAYLTLSALVFTIVDVNNLKKENKQLREDIETLKKQLK